MKIKSVDICGFKSFLDKTSLTFFPGITAMVGPNGCGKSNVVDAIRWALGEQSAKHMRGVLMEDVIFNGSKAKKPVGMAEVSLTFSNENGNAPLQYRDFSEIQITRRIFRSGESEYYINKNLCRLKDITELFMDTGVGTKSYSIIQQGRVDSIINSKPTDLRLLIEEAGGISKYKIRKQEALRKMDATRQNLLRVSDVLGEIQKQINSLKYQAQKLKRFKKVKEQIRTLDLALASQHHKKLLENQAVKEMELGSLRDKQSGLTTEIDLINATIVTKKMQLQKDEEKVSAAQKKSLEIKFLIQEEDNKVERQKEKIDDLKRQTIKAKEGLEENFLRLQKEEEEIGKSKELSHKLQVKKTDTESSLKEEEKMLSVLKEDFAVIQSDLDCKREELFELRYNISHRENDIKIGEKTYNSCRSRLEQNRSEVQMDDTGLEELKKQKNSTSEHLKEQSQEKERLEKEQKLLQNRNLQLENETKEISLAISASKEKQARIESHLESLQEITKNFEGCTDGVRSLMTKKASSETIADEIYGLAADFMETEPYLETAVEAVLGEKLHYMMVKNQSEAIKAIEYLKAGSLGRGTFVPLKDKERFIFNDQTDGSLSNEATPLINLIKVKEEYQPFIHYLLEDTVLVENLSQALAIRERNGFKNKLVTLDGEIIDPMGIITGGIQNNNATGLLGKRREMKELESELASLTSELIVLQKRHNDENYKLGENQKALKNNEERLVQQKLVLQNKERDFDHQEEEIIRVEKKIEFLVMEKKKLAGELDELEEDLENNQQELEDLKEKQSQLNENFLVLQRRENACREKIEAQEKSFHQCRLDLTDLKAQISSLSSALDLRESVRGNCRIEISKCEQIQTDAEKEIQILRKSIDAALVRANDISRDYQALQDKLGGDENYLANERNDLMKEEENLKTIQHKFNDLNPLVQNIDHELNTILSEKHHLEEKIETSYHLSIGDVSGRFPPEDYPEDGTRTKLEKLERFREKTMEAINFNAEKEYEEHLEKYEFYQNQSDDLNRSLDSLQDAIHTINQTSRERFRKTFYKVNENFKEVLPLVFEGGQGELKLTDENDLLETGIEIMVRPAGKTLKSINLLSGGEKSLAALSLLFSLYLFRPSPFCLLDEVDSPLDDANVSRFANILKRFSADSQFILITHNKQTMEIAHTLYGVTMEEPGVSKIISVSLN